MSSPPSSPPRALVVNSGASGGHSLILALEADGFQVEAEADARSAVARARRDGPDLLVLDLAVRGLPRDACRTLRSFSDAYVIVIAADEDSGLEGLEGGADDFVIAPASVREVSARARAMLRRPRRTRAPIEPFVVGPITLDASTREVVVGGSVVPLTRIEFEILQVLMSRPWMVVGRAELIESVWGADWFGDEHVVDVHVSNLRRKIERGGIPRVIRTVRGVGFRADLPASM